MITREKMIPTATVRQDVQDKKAVSQTSLFIGLYMLQSSCSIVAVLYTAISSRPQSDF